MLKPLLIGETIDNIEALWSKMWKATFIQGRMGITVMAMSALDIALWDC
jgi:L-alanine-DL-glutamate epimerase-like enolase superfamily enzyme